ncbi:hypothetical protein HGO38_16255 [Rhizobium sp. CG5]|uniref:hypothetical protein n=1 Tax=Rhizobium sp. CG5 TaxID=2726076 RepID=UPI0020338576|nr:hypothetical protein [Rhizobium sp. CG5]MCM2475033.1 hypothetical protein [Rhizobium sp. CG5]
MQSVYITRKTFSDLADNPRVTDFEFSARRSCGRLRLAVSTDRGNGWITIDFSPLRLEALFSADDDTVLLCRLPEAGNRRHIADQIEAVLNDPAALLWQLSKRDHEGLPRAPCSPSPPSPSSETLTITAATIRSLLSQSLVRDFVVGSDGKECLFQFQPNPNAFLDVSSRAPNDWVGFDFNETQLDCSWFDLNDTYHISSFNSLKAELASPLNDPLGHMLVSANTANFSSAAGGNKNEVFALQASLRDAFQ